MSLLRSVIIAFLAVYALVLPAYAQHKVIIIGDSLTEGYGVSKDKAFPALLEKKLQQNGHKELEVVNAGISGSTSASGPKRLLWLLKSQPKAVVIALGANDGLRGLSVENLKKNLSEMVKLAQKEKIPVLLVGMKVPPNYGKKYEKKFEQAFLEVAKKYKVPLMPFLLMGVGGEKGLNQAMKKAMN